MLKGSLAVPTAISRLSLLREEPYAAGLLVDAVPGRAGAPAVRDVTAVLAGLESRAAEPTLVQLAGHEDAPVRMYAVQGLGKLRSRRADVMLPLLEDKSLGVRREVARALGASASPGWARRCWPRRAPRRTRRRAWSCWRPWAPRGTRSRRRPSRASSTTARRAPASPPRAGCACWALPRASPSRASCSASEDKLVRRQGLALY